MSAFEHARNKIVSKHQHPYNHNIAEISYTNETLAGVITNCEQAFDWIFAVLYPNSTNPVATKAALDALVGNSINDYRVVLSDETQGDVMTAYRYEQREGDVAAKWYLIYKLSWGEESVISGLLNKTMDVTVYKYGYDDRDSDGAALTGINAGQHIFGGASANTHLTLHANSGDGTGANTGYIQTDDNIRPTTDSTYSIGTTTERYLKIWTDEITVSTMTITGGQIVDSSGAISFGDENLSTTGTIAAGTLTIAAGSITDSSGAISFGDENLTTTGTLQAGNLKLSANTLSSEDTDGNIVITPNGSGVVQITNALETVGQTVTGTVGITGQLNIDNIRVDGNTISSTDTDGNLVLSANGSGVVNITSAMTTIGQTVTGTMGITGQLDVDNITINGNTLSSTDTNGNVIIDPNGSGLIELGSAYYPATTSAWDIGKTGNVWNDLWIDGNIQDGSNTFSIANLMTFAAVGAPSSGDSLFWDGSKWVSSAPDTEIDHGTISGLTDSDDHTQYVLLAGRSGGSGGQTIYGSDTTAENLSLIPNSAAANGSVIFTSNLSPVGNNAEDIGGSSHYVKDLYIAGQAIGARLQNDTAANISSACSALTPGRIWWGTDTGDIYIDVGGTAKRITSDNVFYEDAATWDGSTTTNTYDMSSYCDDARRLIWALKDNSNNFVAMGGEIDHPSANTNVRITFSVPIAAGTYTLVGR